MYYYNNWNLDQHPAPMIKQMEKQIREGQAFISTFVWSKHFWNPNKKSFLSQKVEVLDNGESFWIFQKGKKEIKIKMWDGYQIVDPRPFLNFQKKESLKAKCKRLDIFRRAYSGTEKVKKVEMEIEQVERKQEMSIDELILQK